MSAVKDEYDDLLDELGLADSPIKEKIVKSQDLTAEIPTSPQQGMEPCPRENLKPRLVVSYDEAHLQSHTKQRKRPWFHVVVGMVVIDSAAVPNAAPFAQSKDLEAEIDGLLDGLDDSTSAESPATYGGEEVMPPRMLGCACTLKQSFEPLSPAASKRANWARESALMTCAAAGVGLVTTPAQHNETKYNATEKKKK